MRGDQCRTALSTCVAHQPRRPLAVAGLERLDDRAMLLDVVVLPVLRPAPLRQQPPADVGDPEPVEELGEGLVPGRGRDREVEGTARVVHLVGGLRRRLGGDRLPHQLEIRLGAPRRCEPGDLGLEHEPRLEPLADVVEPDLGDEEAAVDLELDEAVAGEPAQRLAHRAARDPEPVGELALAEPRARRERARDDQRADLVVGEADDRADAQRRRRAGCEEGIRDG